MKSRVRRYISIIAMVGFSTTALAQDNVVGCSLEEKTTSLVFGYIEELKDVQTYSKQLQDRNRKCIANLSAKINKKWVDSEGEMVYTPSMSEQEACEKAIDRAKIKAIQQVLPEKVNSTMVMACREGKPLTEKGFLEVDDYSTLPWLNPSHKSYKQVR